MSRERLWKKEKALCLSTFNGTIFLLSEQKALHLHFALCHANCVPDLEVHAKNSKTDIHAFLLHL